MNQEVDLDREVLFFRYCNGTATPLEIEQIEEMIRTSPEIAAELEAVRKAWFIQSQLHEISEVDTLRVYKKIHRKIHFKDKIRHSIRKLSHIAAVFTIPLLISLLVLGYCYRRDILNESTTYMEVTALPGFISKFELPDQSVVYLNKDSKLRYPIRFTGKTREVELTGEGFFEVTASEKRPFIVTTPQNVKVVAHGTRFNVNATGTSCEAVLDEGKINVMLDDNKTYTLIPGQYALVDPVRGQISLGEADVYQRIAWKDGKIIYKNISLPELFGKLSERYNIEILFHDKHNQSDLYQTHLTITNESIYQIMSYLEAAAPIRWKADYPLESNSSAPVRPRIQIWLKKS